MNRKAKEELNKQEKTTYREWEDAEKAAFEKNFCSLCGSQRCGGVDDEEFREGCSHFNKTFQNK